MIFCNKDSTRDEMDPATSAGWQIEEYTSSCHPALVAGSISSHKSYQY